MLITPIYYLSILLCFENIVIQGLRYKESINQTVELLDIEILQHDKSLPKETESSDVLSNYNIDGINTMPSARVLIKNDEIIDNKKGNKINMTGEMTKYNTENEGISNKLTTITKNRLKSTSEANSNNYNGTETYLIIDGRNHS
ncbi:PREDICTED: uncharacterized protein LOC105362444 [Ceratosolen solmsi marchali]|uniref:Uncharacterized protein LOC105362444 n=1 Tax=Ceratosolen solmsi marchali TaxID=326594 RepID=A0AAJ6YHI8_9HYME|nr:PREDICTED: uncharacterized protein LOC105362444 [Ceratosolen solmsi marchali]